MLEFRNITNLIKKIQVNFKQFPNFCNFKLIFKQQQY